MNLVADPILTPTEDKKDANRCQPCTRKREETVLIESRLETWGAPLVLESEGVVDKGTTYPYIDFNFWRKKNFPFTSRNKCASLMLPQPHQKHKKTA